jgi:hypothetical protein
VSPGRTANRNATERNLSQILEHIDVKDPKSSRLLTTPRRKHGRNGRPVFAGQRGDDQFAELESWVIAVARDEVQHSQPDGRSTKIASRAGAGSRDSSRSALAARSTGDSGQPLPDADSFGHSKIDATKSQVPLPPASSDPFDPAAFNRASGRRGSR